jgi:hypothetical protein
MQVQSRQRHVSRGGSRAQTTQDEPQPFDMLRLDTGLITRLEKTAKAFVFEPPDHQNNCNPLGYRVQAPTGRRERGVRSSPFLRTGNLVVSRDHLSSIHLK